MFMDATTASSVVRDELKRTTYSVERLSFAYVSLLLSALFSLFFLLFTVCTATSFCIMVYQRAINRDSVTASSVMLPACASFSLLVDLLFFSLRLHNRAKARDSRITYAAYFREKPASLMRLWGRSSHHRRLFIRWQGALVWMVPLDLLAVVLCVVPVHANANPMQLYLRASLDVPLDLYNHVLTAVSTCLEIVVALEFVVEVCRRCCGQNVVMLHPETGLLNLGHPHEYQEALQNTPPQTSRTASSLAPDDEHPVYAPPAYGYQDLEDAHHMQPQQQSKHSQPQLHIPRSMEPSQEAYTRLRNERLEGEERGEGRLREGKVEEYESVNKRVRSAPGFGTAAREGEPDSPSERRKRQDEDGTAAAVACAGPRVMLRVRPSDADRAERHRSPRALEEAEEEGGGGEGGELGAATEPLVMMMSPALMDDDGAAAEGVGAGPRVMLRVRASDADRPDDRSEVRAQALNLPRYSVLHMSSA